VTETESQKEFRLKRGNKILDYINKFSATEKVIFGILVFIALISTITMTSKATNYFMVEIPGSGGRLHEGLVGLPRTINPVLSVTDVDKDLSSLIYSGLMRYSDGVLDTDLAESYTISKDGLTYDFKLRNDIYFNDGEPVTADDIEFTIHKIQDPNLKSPRRSDWANITIKKIGDKDIQFILKQPYSPFLSNTTVGILPKHIWNNVVDDQFVFSKYNIEPIGSGPYKISSIVYGNSGIPTEYSLNTWRKYYGDKPYIDNFVFSFFSDEENAVSAISNGKIDSLAAISPGTALKLDEQLKGSHEIISSSLPRVFGVFFNQNQSLVLADLNVRKALDMSIDRKAIIKDVLNGYADIIDGPLPNYFYDSHNDKKIVKDDDNFDQLENIALAQHLLEKNGWKKNQNNIYEKKSGKTASTTLAFDIYTADSPDLKQTAELVKNYWTQLGASVNVKVFESGDLYQNIIRTRKYDALLFGEQIGKDRDMYAFWHSSQRNAPGLNVSMYTNSKVDTILESIRSTNNDKIRNDGYNKLDQLIKEDIPAVFLYSPNFIYIIPKQLKGLKLDLIVIPSDRWNSIRNWYLNTEKVWSLLSQKYE
jgi:peptide/nickel transport system substrate-binding protein